MPNRIALRAAISAVLLTALIASGGVSAQAAPGAAAPAAKGVSSAAFAVTKKPVIHGIHRVGRKLTASVEKWTPVPSRFTYQWKRNGHAISGATHRTYKAGPADAGKRVSVMVTGSKAHVASVSRTSASVLIKKSSSAGSKCDPNYSGACVPIASDVDCAGGSGNGPAYVQGPVRVVGVDIYGLDADGDGWGCE